MGLHPFNLRMLAEDLTRVRRPDDRERYAASQRQAKIDPNPHQIDAVIFALRRLREGGCILADEVGLGKTIEAGLVIAQCRAEGARRILLIVPKSLIGQWQNELLTLFGIQVQEQKRDFIAPGVYVVGREFAGSEPGSDALGAVPPFDLVVIDEAHEIFAGLHKRYGSDGLYDESADQARMAHRVRGFLRTAPVLLLTATPMQNSLAELWGLVQYVEPTGTLLGDIETFRRVFCPTDDRTLIPGQEHELQRRLAMVLQRTLRRQAQEFLERKFTQRRCRLYEYKMSDAERSLYEDVTEYLMRPSLHAFAGAQRRFLLIGFHKRMASSLPALASSLENVATRLRRLSSGQQAGDGDEMLRDLDDEDLQEKTPATGGKCNVDPASVASELALVDDFVQRAKALPDDAKARSFQDAIRVVLSFGHEGRGSGKAVVFTESITTQEYLRRLLMQLGLTDEEITLFRGTNDHERARQAHARWVEEVGRHLPPGSRPTREVAVRLALVHEFRTRSKIMVCTEAGAKGLNLQFCETVINYDLPWNPQRIEQRIGRCHRYSQERDVTVVNFIGRDNDAEALLFEILSKKLDLFGKVLDASDVVLHQPTTDTPEPVAGATSVEIESDLKDIYTRARTAAEVTQELAALRDRIEARREAYEREYRRTSQIIESRFDQDVQRIFRRLRDDLPAVLAQLDHDLADLVEGYLASRKGSFVRSVENGRILFEVAEGFDLGADVGDMRRFVTGDSRGVEEAQALNLTHPLVLAALDHAKRWDGGSMQLQVPAAAQPELAALIGKSGVLSVSRTEYAGFEPVQRLVAAAVVDGQPLDPAAALRLSRLEAIDAPALNVESDPTLLADVVEEACFVDQQEIEGVEQSHFERAIGQLERYVEDKALVLRRELASVAEKRRNAEERRAGVVGATARAKIDFEVRELSEREEGLAARIERLASREDEVYRKWRDQYHALRYQAPVVTPLFQAKVRIVEKTGTSC